MKVVFLLIGLSVAVNLYGKCGHENDTLLVVFWNLENFYDYFDGGTGESDTEFSSYGSRHWTKRKFQAKCDAVAKSIFFIKDIHGKMPDLIGLAEIENRGVLTRLLNSTLLRKHGYNIIHSDSGDRRGIDVALLYRDASMKCLSTSFKTPEHEGKKLETREILHAEMRLHDGRVIDFIVNHHPSKFGGEKQSEGRRNAAMTALKNMCDSLGRDRIIAMGDFNDTPDAASFRLIDGILMNMGTDLHEEGEGTIRYEGKWDLIDMFLTSPSISEHAEMQICKIPFLMVWEKKHPGMKPFRTYSGPRYIGGVSDHCPVVLKVK